MPAPLPNTNSTTGTSTPAGSTANPAINPANAHGISNDEQRRVLDQNQKISEFLEKLNAKLGDVTSIKQTMQQGAYNAFGNNFITRGGIAIADSIGETISEAIFGKDKDKKSEDPVQVLLKQQQEILQNIEQTSKKQVSVLESFVAKVENGVVAGSSGIPNLDYEEHPNAFKSVADQLKDFHPHGDITDVEYEEHPNAFKSVADQLKDFHPNMPKEKQATIDEIIDGPQKKKSPLSDKKASAVDAKVKTPKVDILSSAMSSMVSTNPLDDEVLSSLDKTHDAIEKTAKESSQQEQKNQEESVSFFSAMVDMLSQIKDNTKKDRTSADNEAAADLDKRREEQTHQNNKSIDSVEKEHSKLDIIVKKLTTGLEGINKSLTNIVQTAKTSTDGLLQKTKDLFSLGGDSQEMSPASQPNIDLDIDIDRNKPGRVPPGKKPPGKLGRLMRGVGALTGATKLLKAIPMIGTVAAVGGAAYGAYEGYTSADETLGLGREATEKEKLASGAGGVIENLSFGLIDKQKAAKWFQPENSLESMEADLKASDPKKYEEYLADKKKIYQNALIDRGDTALAEADMEQELKKKYQKEFSDAKLNLQSPKEAYSDKPLREGNGSERKLFPVISEQARVIGEKETEAKRIEDSVRNSRQNSSDASANIINSTQVNNQTIMPSRRNPNNNEPSFNRYIDSAFSR